MERGDYVQPATPSLHKLIYGNMASGPWRPIAEYKPEDRQKILIWGKPKINGDGNQAYSAVTIKNKSNCKSEGKRVDWFWWCGDDYFEIDDITHFSLINPPTKEAENG